MKREKGEQGGTYDGGQRSSLNSGFPLRRAWPITLAKNNENKNTDTTQAGGVDLHSCWYLCGNRDSYRCVERAHEFELWSPRRAHRDRPIAS
jgi:hypothetical protein